MPLSPDELAQISALTLAHYQSSAEDFREGTRDHDVSQNIAALLRHIEGEKPWRILDFGCGPGVICAPSAASAIPPSASMAAPNSLPWRVPTAAARSGSKVF